MLEVNNISTGYGKKQVLFDISLEIRRGSIVLLIGGNGSGKSTLLKYLYRLLPRFPGDVGKITFDGKDISYSPPAALMAKGLMYIPQKGNCFDSLTVRENLELSGQRLLNRRKEKIRESLSAFPQLSSLQQQKAGQLSGGERQVLALAMASLHTPKMILMDEPFTGLSPKNIDTVKTYIKTMNRTQGLSFIIVEHHIKESLEISSVLIGMRSGRLAGFHAIDEHFDPKVAANILI